MNHSCPPSARNRDVHSWLNDRSVGELLSWKRQQGKGALDSPEMTLAHGALIRKKAFLQKFYREVYRFFRRESRATPPGIKLEIGSGGGFIKEYIPETVTSDLLDLPGVDQVFSGTALPFPDRSLSAVFLLNVLHHIPDVEKFFQEAGRGLREGGKLILFEPANTWWARFIYRRFHHEPFEPGVQDWRLPPGGPLSMANGALPWILFVRDRRQFLEKFPFLEIENLSFCHPLSYLVSGGLSWPQLLPGFCFKAVRFGESLLHPLAPFLGMFMKVVLTKDLRK